MATRNRTVEFRKYRDTVKSLRTPLSSSASASSGGPVIEMVNTSLLRSSNRSSYTPLSTQDPGPSSSSDAFTVGLPPSWVDDSEEIATNIQRAKVKMSELTKAHAKALMPSFGDGKDDQRQIETLSREITALLRKSEVRLKKLSAGRGSSEESNVRKNVQRSLATDLQNLSMDLRRKHQNPLSALSLLLLVPSLRFLSTMSNANKQVFSVADLSSALNDDGRAELINALKGFNEQPLDILGSLSLSPIVRQRVEVLREIQSAHDELEAKFFEERAALEAKYQNLYQPLYAKRYEIVNGVADVTAVPIETAEVEEKGVPSFWLIALQNNDVVTDEITERDEEALTFLKDIKWSKLQDRKGFKLEFFFDPNPYFSNTVLTKTYHMVDEDEPILERAIGTEINWLPGKRLTEKTLTKKSKKGSKNAKPITKTESCESFFNFFDPPEVPEDDVVLDEEVAEELQNEMEQDYDIGSTIRDKVIPHAVSWFTGEAGDDDDETDDDDDDYDMDEDDDDEEEDDDEESEDGTESEKKSSITKKGGIVQSGDGQQGERPAECKQQ